MSKVYLGTHDFTGATVTGVGGGAIGQGVMSTCFEDTTTSRMAKTLTAGGTVSTTANGAQLLTSSTSTSAARLKFNGNFAFEAMFDTDTKFSCRWIRDISGTDNEFYFGVGNASTSGTTGTFTARQYGFKVIRASSTDTTSATNGSNTTETATSFTPTASVTTYGNYYAEKNSGSANIKFYESNTLRATHTTNLPSDTGANPPLNFFVNNAASTSNCRVQVACASLTWDGAV